MAKRPQPAPALRRAEGLPVTGLDPSGAGVAVTPEGLEVLIPGALPGARVSFDYQPPRPGGRRGLAAGFTELEPSPDLDPARCPLAGECGGCPAGRLAYARELALKTQTLVVKPLVEAGFTATLVRAPIGHPGDRRTGWRNKAVLYPGLIGGEPHFGYYRARSQELVAAESCPQTPVWMGEAARSLAPLLLDADLSPWREADDAGALRALLLREAPGTGERLAALVMRRLPADPRAAEALFERVRAALRPHGLTSLLINLHEAPGSAVLSFAPDATRVVDGRATIRADWMGLSFEVGAQTFLQVNTPQTPVLYRTALDALEVAPEDRVLDLYCGVGTLTLLAARRAREAFGVERVEASIACARENARVNGLENARFTAAPVEKLLASGLFDGWRPTVVIADPAYQGLAGGAAESLAQLLAASGARRLAYVSCNPKSFARDARVLCARGMTLRSVTPVDMFPSAMHLEVVGVFERA